MAMPSRPDAAQVFNRDFLETRGKVLDLAAALDRLDRAPGKGGEHPDRRLAQLRQAIEALQEPGPGRAETVQLLFSDEYDPHWRQQDGGGSRPDRARPEANREA